MSREHLDLKDLTKAYDKMTEKMDTAKEHEGIRAKIEKAAMDPAEIEKAATGNFEKLQARYPELASIDDMGPEGFVELYKKMADDIRSNPGAHKAFTEPMGMTPEQLEDLFREIAGGVKKYPEIWESRENAQMLHPRNLSMLARALKEDTAEAFRFKKDKE